MTKKPRTTGATGKATRARKAAQGATRAPKADQTAGSADTAVDVTAAPRSRTDSKQAKLIKMLRQANGATIREIVTAFGWQPHTVRGAIAGALKKKLGLNVASEKVEDRGRVYRINH